MIRAVYDARAQYRHFSHAILALHVGALVCAVLASYLAAQAYDSPGKRALVTLALIAAVELPLYLPILRRFRSILRDLCESEARKRGLLEAAMDPTFVTDAAGRILELNPAAESVFGYHRRDIRGERVSELLLADGHDLRHEQQLKEYRDTLDVSLLTRRADVKALRATGVEFPAELTVTPIHGAVDGAIFFSVCLRDNTQRKQVERWLVEARESAIAASKVKSDFLANMSHEIRTPLNTVIGMTSLMMGTQLSKTQKDYVTSTRYAADALLELLNDVLDLSKIEAGKLQLEPTEFDLHALVQETADIARMPATKKHVDLRVTILDTAPSGVTSDPGRIRQVLLNLITNAVKFTSHGKVVVRVSGKTGSPGSTLFEVEDTGVGIAPEIQSKLFAPFTQADGSTTRRYGGTGLGLVISKRIVEALGGEIGFESQPGRGSRFWFRLPLRPGQARALDSAINATIEQLPRPDPSQPPPRVLVVEDNAVNLKMTVRMLETLGYCADPAGNGREAITAVERSRYDIVLMDCQMPEVDGFQATATIRTLESQVPGTRKLPIIAVTGNVTSSDRQDARASGMDDFLPKPVTLESLARVVDTWLKREQAEAAHPLAPHAAPPPSQEAPTLDRAVLESLRILEREGEPSFLHDLVATFTNVTPKRLTRMRTALDSRDGGELSKAAHTLKTAAASLGAMSLSALCRELESAGKRGLLEDSTRLVGQIENEYARAKVELEMATRGP